MPAGASTELSSAQDRPAAPAAPVTRAPAALSCVAGTGAPDLAPGPVERVRIVVTQLLRTFVREKAEPAGAAVPTTEAEGRS